LHHWLINNYDFISDENRERLTIKKVAELSGIKYQDFSKGLKLLYDDILDENFKHPEKFLLGKKYLCDVSFDYLGCRSFMSLGLNAIPKEWEGFDFEFILPRCGSASYYVKSVGHKINNNSHGFDISVTSEYPNKYSDLLIEKGVFHREISFHDYLFLEKRRLEEIVYKLYNDL
jgi:hypothetical protein